MATGTNYGRDTSVTDGRRTGRLVSGARLVGEALYRRFITRRGTLRGGKRAKEYGFALHELIGTTPSAAELAAIPGRVKSEASKERRLIRCDVAVTAARVGVATTLDITIVGHTADGPFTLVLRVEDVTVQLFGLSAGVS